MPEQQVPEGVERYSRFGAKLVPACDGEWLSVSALPAIRKQERERVREILEGVDEFYGEALGLIRDLLWDAERIYEPGFEDPPHIAAAKDLGDHEGTLKRVRAALDTLGDDQ